MAYDPVASAQSAVERYQKLRDESGGTAYSALLSAAKRRLRSEQAKQHVKQGTRGKTDAERGRQPEGRAAPGYTWGNKDFGRKANRVQNPAYTVWHDKRYVKHGDDAFEAARKAAGIPEFNRAGGNYEYYKFRNAYGKQQAGAKPAPWIDVDPATGKETYVGGRETGGDSSGEFRERITDGTQIPAGARTTGSRGLLSSDPTAALAGLTKPMVPKVDMPTSRAVAPTRPALLDTAPVSPIAGWTQATRGLGRFPTGGNSVDEFRDRRMPGARVTGQGGEAGTAFTGTPEPRMLHGTAPGAPAPVSYDREGRPIAGVSGRMHDLLDSDSPYLERARTRGLQHANRRGLLSSSIAAGASEASAIDAALPIATADANIAAEERGLRSSEYMQSREHRVRQLMQERGLDHDAAQRHADRELRERDRVSREYMHERALYVQQVMQEYGLEADAAQRHADRVLAVGEAHAHREFVTIQAALDREAGQFAQERGIAHEAAMSEASRRLQSRIARDTATRDINSEYMRLIGALTLNTDIPVEERRAMEDHFAWLRDESMRAIQQIYDYQPVWTSGRRPPQQEAA